jgi:hypothetical protein
MFSCDGNQNPVYISDDAVAALEFFKGRVVAKLSAEGCGDFNSVAAKHRTLSLLAAEMLLLKSMMGRKGLLKRSAGCLWVAKRALDDAQHVYKDEKLMAAFTQLFEFFEKLSVKYVDWQFSQIARLSSAKNHSDLAGILVSVAQKILLALFLSALTFALYLLEFLEHQKPVEDRELPPHLPIFALPQIQATAPNCAA